MAPNKKNILLVAFALGLLVPAVIIFMQENMNTKVRGKKDLENLSVPYLGEIPLYSNNKKKKNKYFLIGILVFHKVHVGAKYTKSFVDDVAIAFFHHDCFFLRFVLLFLVIGI